MIGASWGSPEAWGNNVTGAGWAQGQQQQNSFNLTNFGDIEIVDYIEQQIIQLEPSPAHDMLEQLKKTGQAFKDDRFPPSLNSLTGEWGNVQ